jgi:FixJ family two-component response regulator
MLTERERQIMSLVVIGRANKQIAAELTQGAADCDR